MKDLRWTFVILMFVSLSRLSESNNELRAELLKNYKKNIPPVVDGKTNVSVSVLFLIDRIVDMDVGGNVFKVNGRFLMKWQDNRLNWDSMCGPFPKVSWLVMPIDRIWTPKYRVLNRAFSGSDIPSEGGLYASMPGNVYAYYQVIGATTCDAKMKRFPYDTHQCQIHFGLWSTEGDSVQLVERWTRAYYWRLFPSKSWKIVHINHSLGSYSAIPGFQENAVTYTYTVQRSSPITSLGTLCPSVLGALPALLAYWMSPTQPGLRMSLPLTSLLITWAVCSRLISILPASTLETPIIVEYSLTCLILSALSVFHSILVIFLHGLTSSPRSEIIGLMQRSPLIFAIHLWGMIHSRTTVDHEPLFESKTDSDKEVQRYDWNHVVLLMDVVGFSCYVVVLVLLAFSIVVTE